MNTEFEKVLQYVVNNFNADIKGIHGIQHWRRVELYGKIIANSTKADMAVVRLFAIIHDAARLTEGPDEDHGQRAADLALKLRGDLYQLDDERFKLLYQACKNHSRWLRSGNPTIGACWDADRIDLQRLGIPLDPGMMSTEYGKRMANSR